MLYSSLPAGYDFIIIITSKQGQQCFEDIVLHNTSTCVTKSSTLYFSDEDQQISIYHEKKHVSSFPPIITQHILTLTAIASTIHISPRTIVYSEHCGKKQHVSFVFRSLGYFSLRTVDVDLRQLPVIYINGRLPCEKVIKFKICNSDHDDCKCIGKSIIN